MSFRQQGSRLSTEARLTIALALLALIVGTLALLRDYYDVKAPQTGSPSSSGQSESCRQPIPSRPPRDLVVPATEPKRRTIIMGPSMIVDLDYQDAEPQPFSTGRCAEDWDFQTFGGYDIGANEAGSSQIAHGTSSIVGDKSCAGAEYLNGQIRINDVNPVGSIFCVRTIRDGYKGYVVLKLIEFVPDRTYVFEAVD